jgi:hypothetical protein
MRVHVKLLFLKTRHTAVSSLSPFCEEFHTAPVLLDNSSRNLQVPEIKQHLDSQEFCVIGERDHFLHRRPRCMGTKRRYFVRWSEDLKITPVTGPIHKIIITPKVVTTLL